MKIYEIPQTLLDILIVKIEEGGLDLFYFYFYFYFLFLEQLGLGLISHAVTSVTNMIA